MKHRLLMAMVVFGLFAVMGCATLDKKATGNMPVDTGNVSRVSGVYSVPFDTNDALTDDKIWYDFFLYAGMGWRGTGELEVKSISSTEVELTIRKDTINLTRKFSGRIRNGIFELDRLNDFSLLPPVFYIYKNMKVGIGLCRDDQIRISRSNEGYFCILIPIIGDGNNTYFADYHRIIQRGNPTSMTPRPTLSQDQPNTGVRCAPSSTPTTRQ